jgi:Ca2+-binding RTX toxin-like protein
MGISIDSAGVTAASPRGTPIATLSSTQDYDWGVRTTYYNLKFTSVSGGPFSVSGTNVLVNGNLTSSQYTVTANYSYSAAYASWYGSSGSTGSGTFRMTFGLDGNDQLIGGSTDDMIIGNGGSDTIFGGAGNDTMNANMGNDTLYGEDGDDSVRGGKDNDSVSGGAGNDSVFGDNDNDTVAGGAGDDTIRGGRGKDILYADDDNDELWGDKGDDTMYGGSGHDLFFFTHHDTESGHDVIADFDPTSDQIALIVSGSSYGTQIYDDIKWRLTDTTSGVIVNLDDGNSVLLCGVSSSQLASAENWFLS